MSRRLDMLNREMGFSGFAEFSNADIVVDPENVKRRVNDRLNADLSERKLYMRHKIFKTVAAAAAVTGLVATSAFAISPAGQEAINSIITYFTSDKAVEITSMEKLEQYNEEIGKSVTRDGVTLTLDNVAADDNFIHIFYTIKSEDEPFYEGDSTHLEIYSDRVKKPIWVECAINGKTVLFANHNVHDGYFADDHTYKGVDKYNISAADIPDDFKVELYGYAPDKKGNDTIEKLYADPPEFISDEEKQQLWYIGADIDKSKVKVDSLIKEVNQKLPWSGATVDKVVFSPFGNQLVISTEADTDEGAVSAVDMFALYDDKGTALDVLNTDLCGGKDGVSVNSLEFLKADKDTKQLKLVPFSMEDDVRPKENDQKIGTYPIVYQANEYGKVIVTDIRISDGEVDIDYYKDGFVLFDPGFALLDDNGNNAEPGGKLGCTLYTDVNHETNSYTARYVYEEYTDDGELVPFENGPKAEDIKRTFTTLGYFDQMYIKLDFDKAVTVDLK